MLYPLILEDHLELILVTADSPPLRQAQIAAISGEDRRLQHPFYWAAFILIGNGL